MGLQHSRSEWLRKERKGKLKRAIYPGSFDPVTCGHLDIIKRASRIFDELYVVVFENVGKSPLFTAEERVEMLVEACKGMENVRVSCSSGLLVDFARKHGIQVIIKGLRAVSDFDYEFKMALMNKKLAPEVDTLFMMTSVEYLFLSSSLVKETVSYGGCVEGLVPPNVLPKLRDKFRRHS